MVQKVPSVEDCGDAATESLIRSILEEEQRLAQQREVEEKKSLALAKQLEEDDAKARAQARAPPAPSSQVARPSDTSLEAFCALAPGELARETVVESIVLNVGGKVYRGSFAVNTNALRNYLEARLQRNHSRGSADAGRHKGSGRGGDESTRSGGGDGGGGGGGGEGHGDDGEAGNFVDSMGDALRRVTVGANGAIAGGKEDFHQDDHVQMPTSFDSG